MPSQSDKDALILALAEALSQVDDAETMRRVLADLCTPAELSALSERWHVAQLLDQGALSYRQINQVTGVSTTTIGRVARFLLNEPHQGYKALLAKTSSLPKQESE